MKRTQGLTLVEMLVVMVLLGILMSVIVNFFVSQRKAASLQRAINEASEASRTALSLITWDIQNAGYRVAITDSRKAIEAIDNSYLDTITILFRDDTVATRPDRKVSYAVGGDPISLRREEYNAVDKASATGLQPSVASVVAINIRYETRANQFISPTGSGSSRTCPADSTPIPAGATGLSITNCSVNWVYKDTPERLVRNVKVQLLARSESPVQARQNEGKTFSFDGVSSLYKAEPGYVYQFSEQTIVVPNLGR